MFAAAAAASLHCGDGAPSPPRLGPLPSHTHTHTHTPRGAAAGGAVWALLPLPPQEHPARGRRREALAISSVLVLPPLPPPPGITRASRSQAAALVAMMMMSRTQPLGEGRGGCVCGGGRAAISAGEAARRERELAGGRRGATRRAGAEKVLSLPPQGARRGRRRAAGRAPAGSMTRPAGTVTWVRGSGGDGGAPIARMGSEGLAGGGRQCSERFWRLRRIGRSGGARTRLADRHFTSSREGGGSRGDGFSLGCHVFEVV
ncbi:uncharacterized protein LOC120363280 [Saimiri boliviensis]|uniref:uncharacterized protein LOC120363280 n=1 Tax=Saimiri boliviensis TaxID=27679 RepID=UPI003D76CFD2